MELFVLVCMSCCALSVPPFALAFVYLVRIPGVRDRTQQLGEALGFEPGPAARRARWWVGTHRGHPAALAPVALQIGRAQLHHRTIFGLRLVVIPSCEPLEAVVFRSVTAKARTETFEGAFQRIGEVDTLPEAVKEAMLAYVQQHDGGLRIRNRADAPPQLLGPVLFRDAQVVVAAEFTRSICDVASVRARLDAMVRIAEALEAGSEREG